MVLVIIFKRGQYSGTPFRNRVKRDRKKSVVDKGVFESFVFLGGILAITAVMQLPAYLIAREQYSLLVFGMQELQLFALPMLFLAVAIWLPSKNLTLTFSGLAGFCGGIFGRICSSGFSPFWRFSLGLRC